MRAQEFGTNPKRPSRAGSRPERGHEPVARYKTDEVVLNPNRIIDAQGRSAANPYGNVDSMGNAIKSPVNRDNVDMDKVTARAKAMFQKGMTEQQVRDALIKQGVAQRLADQAVQAGQMNEGKTVKQQPQKPRNFVAKNAINTGAGAHKDKKKAMKQGDVKHKGKQLDLAETWTDIEEWLDEEGKASRRLCTSGIPDKDLGASQLASCKSQGLRARDGNKSHLIGHGNSSVRITVGGKKIKGKKYGGPLPDYGTRKNQK